MQAVILAAGLGSRIREFHDLPKGFICIDEEPIIKESVQRLKQAGINDILIVTGYRAEFYDEIAESNPSITTIHNENYNTSGSLYSLYCARDWIKESFLILESDLIYGQRALYEICNDPHPNIILLSGATKSGDEVYVQANDSCLMNMSKQLETLDERKVYGEFVGINKLSYAAYQQLLTLLEKNPELLNSGNYEEDGLVALTSLCSIYCLKVPDLLWCEIDNFLHFQRAKELYPLIANEMEGEGYAA